MAKNKINTCSALYTPKVMEAFKNPHNYGKIKNADGIGKVGNIVCGDVMWLYIKVAQNKKKEDVIKDVKFETFGCVAAISTSYTITDLVKGKTISQALKIKKDDIIKKLGGLPSIKYHCSVLAVDALIEGVYDYYSKNKKEIPADLQEKHDKIQKEKEIIENGFTELEYTKINFKTYPSIRIIKSTGVIDFGESKIIKCSWEKPIEKQTAKKLLQLKKKDLILTFDDVDFICYKIIKIDLITNQIIGGVNVCFGMSIEFKKGEKIKNGNTN